jgi:histidine triad (HIT) family protein
MKKDDCLFCKIIAGEIPSNKVYEDDYVLAFEDVAPMMPVHTLIVPKNHYNNIADNITDEDMAKLMGAVGKVAKIKGVDETGFRVIINTGDDSCQSVHHVHVHVLGGAQMNDGDPTPSE